MKRFIPALLTFILILSGCGSSRKNLERGNYDAAIDKAVRQLRRDPGDEKQAVILERSYRIANEQDNERIRFLKMENKPSNWDEVYLISKRMSDRQALVRTVTPLTISGKTIDFPYVDYMPEMVAAKRKSADYYYAHGNELMKNGLKESYRQAFDEFVRAKEYVGDYEGIDNKIAEAKYLGTSRVLVSIRNRSIINFPPEFEEELLALDLPRLNTPWVEYHTQNLDPNLNYDYMVDINIRNVVVSPDQTLQRDTVVKKEVEDGFVYMLDKKGNVMKDSLGNDIKTPKYKTLQCALIESVQRKTCVIDGDIEVIQLNPNKVIKKDPLGAKSDFEHVSARALGDVQALSASQLERTKSKPVPFPSDAEMILRCSETLKQAIRTAVQSNRRFIN
ncbi:MAG: hypothetical protein HPY62_08745 [Bacteroidales bacterium]|nr:hypothetical protein [Bacteroidales bacterium]